jgi:hypothetical protein
MRCLYQNNRCLHQNLLHQPTKRKNQLKEMMQDPVKSLVVLQPKKYNHKVMYSRYLFDSEQDIDLSKKFYMC